MEHTPIHIAMVSGSLGGGGAERVTSTLLRNLDRSRFTLSLCLLRNRVSYPCPSDVRVLTPNGPSQGTAQDYYRPLASVARYRPWVIPQSVNRLRRQIDALRPDVVLSNIDQVNLVTGFALRGIRMRPAWIARVGNNPAYESRWLKRWRTRTYKQADQIVANSHGLADAFRRFHGLDADHVSTIRNPTDFDTIEGRASEPLETSWIDSRPLIVCVGRLNRQKRFDLLVKAFARLRLHRDARLVICGEGPLRNTIEHDLATLGLQHSAQILGYCDNPYAWMRRADLVVLASDYEGLPNALIEAQGLGTPVVATQCHYGPEEIVVHGQTGLLVPTGNPDALAAAALQLLNDPARRAAMGKRARILARERFGVTRLVGQWSDLFVEQNSRRQRGANRFNFRAA